MATHVGKLVVNDQVGLHVRPAGQIVKLVNESGLEVRISQPGKELIKANSPLRLMALKAKSGEELHIEIDSEDAEQASALIIQMQSFLEG